MSEAKIIIEFNVSPAPWFILNLNTGRSTPIYPRPLKKRVGRYRKGRKAYMRLFNRHVDPQPKPQHSFTLARRWYHWIDSTN